MSVKSDGIDLNSVVDSIEANNDSGFSNRFKNETLMRNYGDQGDAGGVSVDVARVLGESNGTLNVRGSVDEVLNGEIGTVGRNESWEEERMSLNIESQLQEKNLKSEEGVIGDETQKDDGNLCLELKRVGNGLAREMTERVQNQGMEVHVLPQNAHAGDKFGFIMDLDATNNSLGGVISDDVNNGTRINECLSVSNLPVSVAMVESTSTVENGNPNMLIEDEISNGSAEDLDAGDVKHAALEPKVREKESQTEKEGEYYVPDLVWGKVRSHPWWPGQIFEPSAASKKAIEYFKKDSYLIAYFGDQTFAWSEALKIKPFHMYFSQMEKQSKGETFGRAVDSALNEVSRRIEFGLACRCLKEEVISSVSSQVIVSAGIQEQSSRICGTDNFSTAGSFFPENLVNYLKSLAEAPNAAIDRLEFVKARARFLAFNRWKGFLQLAVFEGFDGVLENDVIPSGLQTNGMMEEVVSRSNTDDQVLSGKAKSPAENSSQKKKQRWKNDECKKQKKHIMELVLGGSPCLPNVERKSEGEASKKFLYGSSRQKRKVDDVILNESRAKRRKGFSSQRARSETSSPPRKHIEVGEHIFGAAGKLPGSTLSPESGNINRATVEHGRKSLNVSGSGVSAMNKGKSLRRLGLRESPPAVEMLSQLINFAKNPIEGYSSLIPIAGFFSDFRKSICMEYNNPQGKIKSLEKQKVENSCDLESAGMFKFEGMEDSYWTDRIIESRLDGQILFEPETCAKNDSVVAEPESMDRMNPNTVYGHQINTMAAELDAENSSHVVDDKTNECSPTALILNFSSLESIPPIPNLNEIFSPYGSLNVSETEVLSKSKRAKVVFNRRSDAETAFSSTGKFSIFGPSLVSYRLKYLLAPHKTTTASKRKGRRSPH